MGNPKTLSTVYAVDAVFWILASLPVLYSVLRHRKLPRIGPVKFRSFSGPFSASLTIDTMVPLILIFVVVSGFKLLTSYWLSQFRLEGAILGLVLTGISVFFWYGFISPIGPLFGVPELTLTVLVWSSLQ